MNKVAQVTIFHLKVHLSIAKVNKRISFFQIFHPLKLYSHYNTLAIHTFVITHDLKEYIVAINWNIVVEIKQNEYQMISFR